MLFATRCNTRLGGGGGLSITIKHILILTVDGVIGWSPPLLLTSNRSNKYNKLKSFTVYYGHMTLDLK